MPIYEYECDDCGKIKEALQKFSDKPLETCGACSGRLRKLVSKSSFHLKGTGWYVTDYPKEGKKDPDAPSEKGETTASDAKDAPDATGSSDKKETPDSKKETPAPKKETSAPKKETSAPSAEKSKKKSDNASV